MDRPAAQQKDTSIADASLAAVRKELTATNGQKARLYELLELGAYDIPTFRARMEKAREKLDTLEQKEAELLRAAAQARTAHTADLAPRIRAVLDAYAASDVSHRNALLKSVLQAARYSKPKKAKPAAFALELDLKYSVPLPQSIAITAVPCHL